MRYNSNFCSNLESWSDKDDRPIVETKIEEFKDKSENPSSHINDIECVECLGYGYVECERLKEKVMTVESSTNKVEESITYENKCESEEVMCEEIVVECESKKYLVDKQVEEKKLEIQSIIKNEELMICCDYTNNLNHAFSSPLRVLVQDFKPYKDPFEDMVMTTFEDFLPYQFVKTISTFQVHSQF